MDLNELMRYMQGYGPTSNPGMFQRGMSQQGNVQDQQNVAWDTLLDAAKQKMGRSLTLEEMMALYARDERSQMTARPKQWGTM